MPGGATDERDAATAVPGVDAVAWECCCCSRRSAVRLLAGAYLLLALASLVLSALVAQRAGERGESAEAAADALLRNSLRDLRAFHIVFALMSAVQVMANLGLLAGAHQGRPSLIAPWLWTYGATAALLLAAAGFYAVTSLSRPLPIYDVHGFFAFVFLLAICLPLVYTELAVLKLYRQLRGLATRQFAWEKLADDRQLAGASAAAPAAPAATPAPAPTPLRGYGTGSRSQSTAL